MKRKLSNESSSELMAAKLLRVLACAERVYAIDPRIAQLATFVEHTDQGISGPLVVIDGSSAALPLSLPSVMRQQELILYPPPPPPATATPPRPPTPPPTLPLTTTMTEIQLAAVEEDTLVITSSKSSSLTAEQRM